MDYASVHLTEVAAIYANRAEEDLLTLESSLGPGMDDRFATLT